MKSSIAELEAEALRVWLEGRSVCLTLADEREIRFPAAKNRRLRDATGLQWPDLDEDLSVLGILEGRLGQP